jgi:hypothetical protein
MKKKFILCTLVVSCVIFIASCVTISKTESGSTRNVVGLGVVQIPTVVNLDVQPTKVSELFTVKTKNAFSLFSKKSAEALSKDRSIAAAKAHAVAKLLVKHNADVLIAPRFSFETMSTRKSSTYNLIVSGYPATYKNFRPAVDADTSLLKMKPIVIEAVELIGTLETE